MSESHLLEEQLLALMTRTRRPIPELKRARYEKALVSFIDLLGFRDFVARSPARHVAQALSLFYRTGLELSQPRESVRVYAFSDSIVRVRRVHSRAGRPDSPFTSSPLALELNALAAIQFELACWYGVFLRGALTFGEIYARRNMIFGPALVDAYLLESRHAVYPRILVDPRIFSVLRSGNSLWVHMDEQAKRLYGGGEQFAELDTTAATMSDSIVKDEQSVAFIDYLNVHIKGADLGFVASHRNAIAGAYKLAEEPRVREKYGWLAHYHNFCIRSDINFEEIGLNESNVDKFSLSDSEMLSTVRPAFQRVRRFDHPVAYDLGPPLDNWQATCATTGSSAAQPIVPGDAAR